MIFCRFMKTSNITPCHGTTCLVKKKERLNCHSKGERDKSGGSKYALKLSSFKQIKSGAKISLEGRKGGLQTEKFICARGESRYRVNFYALTQ